MAAMTPMTIPAIAPPLSPEEADICVSVTFPVAIAGRKPSVVVGLIDVATVLNVELVTRNGTPAVPAVAVVVVVTATKRLEVVHQPPGTQYWPLLQHIPPQPVSPRLVAQTTATCVVVVCATNGTYSVVVCAGVATGIQVL